MFDIGLEDFKEKMETMNLYYVRDDSNSYRLVVYATCPWNARYKATKWMHEEYDVDIPVHEWWAEVCDNSIVIE